ncbi:MAG: branched chain amino acid aminotransferase, partial [Lachnospiraceae bacterium]|nr:branched chain amino acid aminotransferase [Lachnospiraceae bacterium]
MDIKFVKNTNPKEKPDQNKLGFGKYMTDHMFIMDYDEGEGWHDARIVPYGPIQMEPNAIALHYAQETFEGLKAYRTADGGIQLFRPEMNAKRMINSNARLCMPPVPVEMFIEAIEALV